MLYCELKLELELLHFYKERKREKKKMIYISIQGFMFLEIVLFSGLKKREPFVVI